MPDCADKRHGCNRPNPARRLARVSGNAHLVEGEYESSTLKSAVAAELKVAAAIAAARAVFEERFGGLVETSRKTAVAALEANHFLEDEEQAIKSPACGFDALASGSVEAEWRYEQVSEYDFEPILDATFFPDALKCRVCGLKLSGLEELRAAGVEQGWEIDVDPEPYYEGPDDDW